MDLNLPLEKLTRVGKTTASRLKKLGLQTVEDLIFYFPFRYEDFRKIVKIKDLQPGQMITVRGKIELIANRRSYRTRKNVTEAIIADDTEQLKVVWFNQPYIAKTLRQGDEVFLSGKVSGDQFTLQMVSPMYEKIRSCHFGRDDNKDVRDDTTHTARLVPIYPLTAGVTEKQIRFLVKQTLGAIKEMPEFLPEEILQRNNFLSLAEALEQIHFPKDKKKLSQAQQRLGFNELFLIQLGVQNVRAELQKDKAIAVKFLQKPTQDFVKKLPFELTADQKKVSWEILQDMEKARPMNRIIQGDVGSGKTVTVGLAILNVLLNGYKVVLMAPTEILAKQHFQTFKKLFAKNKFDIALFTRGQKFVNQEKFTPKKMLDKVGAGEFDLLIGTHAVIQDKVKIPELGLVLIDEQHRFGVNQRKRLAKATEQDFLPHFLSMTATPIPRSLMLTVYGDLDLSIIKQMPAGRKLIITRVVDEKNRGKAYDFMREQIKAGRQVFVVCPLIDPSDTLGYKSVTQEHEFLDQDVFPDLKIGLLHGRLKPLEKEQVMQDFQARRFDILVSTSVIEVGIDVPNASIMMIEGADRFGLAQLHQFRGRVGRSEHQSYCFLFSSVSGAEIMQRLKYMEKCSDGFSLAEKDLEMRGAGEIYGVQQSGLPDLKVADLTDVISINLAQKEAKWAIQNKKITPELQQALDRMNLSLHFE